MAFSDHPVSKSREEHSKNSNIETRNPKQFQNINAQNSKQRNLEFCFWGHLNLGHWDLFRVSIFEFRIYKYPHLTGPTRYHKLQIVTSIFWAVLHYKLIAPHIGASQSNFSSSANVVSNLSANWAGMGAARRIFKSA